MLNLGFIGAGTIGSALALGLSNKGYPVVAVFSRREISIRSLAEKTEGCLAAADSQQVAELADLVFITTPDGAISQVAGQLKWRQGQMAVHCSGADTADILEPALKQGAAGGVFHPLQSFAGLNQAMENMAGSTFALEAEAPLLEILKGMATALGGRWIELKAGDKVLYHAAAVITSNYLVTLINLATELWQAFGVPKEEAVTALLPLLKGTVNNIEAIGIPQCLTGPIARGDNGTIEKHLAALKETTPEVLTTYRELGLKTIPVALAKGKIDERQAKALAELLANPASHQR